MNITPETRKRWEATGYIVSGEAIKAQRLALDLTERELRRRLTMKNGSTITFTDYKNNRHTQPPAYSAYSLSIIDGMTVIRDDSWRSDMRPIRRIRRSWLVPVLLAVAANVVWFAFWLGVA